MRASGILIAIAFGLACSEQEASAATLRGTVQTGVGATRIPLSKVKVTLYEAAGSRARKLGQAKTDSAGQFEIDSPSSQTSSLFYATADVGLGVTFLSVFGPSLPPTITINELSTVAGAYSTAQFSRSGEIAGPAFGLGLAAGMNENLVSVFTGEPSPVLLESPNADQTNSLRSLRSLGNLLAACVRSPGVTAAFLALTQPARGQGPRNSAQALASLCRDPGRNVLLIFALTKLGDSYHPPLVRAPDAWTLTVKVNDSGDDNFLFGGPAAVRFDSRGYAWVANNTIQGETVSARHIMVLKPNGKPSDGTNGTPLSPVKGGGILGVGLGVEIDPFGGVWFGNFGWGGDNPTPDGNGSVTQLTLSGSAVSGPLGYQGGPVRAQGIESDRKGNIWIASFGNDSVWVFPQGDSDSSIGFAQYSGSAPFDIALTRDGSAWVTNGGGFDGGNPSSVSKLKVNRKGEIEEDFLTYVGQALKMVTLDSQGNAWVASQGDNSVYAFRPNGAPLGAFTGGGINGPWGMTVDGEDNIWVSNFGPLELTSDLIDNGISKLCGAVAANRPPGKRLGDPLSPSTGYTVHSAGSPVLLHDGTPLYGPGGPPSFAPMMRQTGLSIDQAGNIWTVNNWKADFAIDATKNPGGDGIVIYVGLAPPPK